MRSRSCWEEKERKSESREEYSPAEKVSAYGTYKTDYGLGFQVRVLKTSEVVPSSLKSGLEYQRSLSGEVAQNPNP